MQEHTKKMKPGRSIKPAITDDRFSHANNDPIFRRVPKKERKIDIDKRFQSMFHSKQFKLQSSVDKRGRPIDMSTNEDLRQYYNIVEDDENEASDHSKHSENDNVEEEKADETKVVSDSGSSESEGDKIEGNIAEEDIGKSDPSMKLSKSMRKKLRDENIDYARGDGLLREEESSDDSLSTADEQDDVEDTTHAWGELDRDAERTEEATSRLALCNMDWDRLKAVDLMVLFHSFLQPGGVLKVVNIYTSDYGKQRLLDEDVHGPLELRLTKPEFETEGTDDEVATAEANDEDDEEGGGYHMEKLRRYQLNRLKYYYGVLEFDSVATAEKIYAECDGMEYESSATRVDLRYIPDDMTFVDEPKDSCDLLPQVEKYRPRFFTTTALQQAKVHLTWDETDSLRKELTQKVHNPKEKIDDEDLRAYLASSESEDEINDHEEGSDTTSNVDPAAKYRALLESIATQEQQKKDKDVEMEITWGVGLKKKTESLVKKKMEEQNATNLTPWEEILKKKKEKRKEKKKRRGQDKEEENSEKESGSEDRDQMFSGDDVNVDMNDPFFKDEIESNEIMKKGSGKKKKGVEVNARKQKDVKPSEVDNAALELLLMDESDNRQHFSLKKIIKAENEKKTKKNRKGKTTLVESKTVADEFQVDVEDSRFGALFSHHLYNVDPSDPNYKKTKGMEAIIEEKQKRRINQGHMEEIKSSTNIGPPNPKLVKKTELSYLINSVKRNTQNLKKSRSSGNKSK